MASNLLHRPHEPLRVLDAARRRVHGEVRLAAARAAVHAGEEELHGRDHQGRVRLRQQISRELIHLENRSILTQSLVIDMVSDHSYLIEHFCDHELPRDDEAFDTGEEQEVNRVRRRRLAGGADGQLDEGRAPLSIRNL